MAILQEKLAGTLRAMRTSLRAADTPRLMMNDRFSVRADEINDCPNRPSGKYHENKDICKHWNSLIFLRSDSVHRTHRFKCFAFIRIRAEQLEQNSRQETTSDSCSNCKPVSTRNNTSDLINDECENPSPNVLECKSKPEPFAIIEFARHRCDCR